jgi:Methylamine utilisation protein MauE
MVGETALLIGAICRLGMAAIFAQSAWHALRDLPRHEAAVAGYKLLPSPAVPIAAIVLPLLTASAALLLPWPATAHAASALGIALMALFTASIAINLHRGRTNIDCGCGGAEGPHISQGLIIRNAALIALLAVSLIAQASSIADPMALVAELGGAAGIAALYFASTQLLANSAAMRAEASPA